jgi:hypothetical protein
VHAARRFLRAALVPELAGETLEQVQPPSYHSHHSYHSHRSYHRHSRTPTTATTALPTHPRAAPTHARAQMRFDDARNAAHFAACEPRAAAAWRAGAGPGWADAEAFFMMGHDSATCMQVSVLDSMRCE